MRIIGGRFRGLRLAPIGRGAAGATLRPTSDRVRESLFGILESGFGNPVPGARVLDLFAGTGALGLEALSRGAVQATLVDDSAAAGALIRRNTDRLRASDATRLLRRDATRLGVCRGAAFGLIFLDPPYGRGLVGRALASALAGGWIAPGAVIVAEERQPPAPVAGLTERDRRRYGDTTILFLEHTG